MSPGRSWRSSSGCTASMNAHGSMGPNIFTSGNTSARRGRFLTQDSRINQGRWMGASSPLAPGHWPLVVVCKRAHVLRVITNGQWRVASGYWLSSIRPLRPSLHTIGAAVELGDPGLGGEGRGVVAPPD